MADRSKIIGRIRALMNKTVDNGCTEEEALTAAEKVSHMMAEHDIEAAELGFTDEKCLEALFNLKRGTKHPVHFCFPAVAEYTGTKGYYACSRVFGSNYFFFGMPVDTEIAQYLMKMIYNCMEKSAREFKNSGAYAQYSHGKKARDSFLKGMAITISSRLREMANSRRQEMQTSTGRDLVVVKDQVVTQEFTKLDRKIREVKQPGIKVSAMDAFQHGVVEGKKVNLTTGVNSATKNHLE